MAACKIDAYCDERLNILLVCKRWKDLVEETPSLWSVISRSHPWNVVKRALVFSRQHPLVVYLPTKPKSRTVYRNQIRYECQDLLPHCHRFRALRLTGAVSAYKPIFQQPAPRLEFLTISILVPVTIGNAFAGHTPHLIEAHIITTYLQSEAGPLVSPLRNLRTLEIGYWKDWGYFEAVLKASPTLKELKISKSVDIPDLPVITTAPLLLPGVTKLSFYETWITVADFIARRINVPNMSSFRMFGQIPSHQARFSTRGLIAFLGPWTQCTMPLHTFIRVTDKRVCWGPAPQHADDGYMEFRFDHHNMNIGIAALDMIGQVMLSSHRDVRCEATIRTRFRDWTPEVQKAVGRLPGIVSLRLWGDCNRNALWGVKEWLEYLTRAEQTYPLCDLEEVYIPLDSGRGFAEYSTQTLAKRSVSSITPHELGQSKTIRVKELVRVPCEMRL